MLLGRALAGSVVAQVVLIDSVDDGLAFELGAISSMRRKSSSLQWKQRSGLLAE